MYGTLILGGGPGGTGPLVWAAQSGELERWLDDGICLVDRSPMLGGSLGQYAINSDSLGRVYLECMSPNLPGAFFDPLRKTSTVRQLASMSEGFPPLPLVHRHLENLGIMLAGAITEHPKCALMLQSEIQSLHLEQDGTVTAQIAREDGLIDYVSARTVILALGGRQRPFQGFCAPGLGTLNLDQFNEIPMIPSDRMLKAEGLNQAKRLLDRAPCRRVVILGGSHSAFSLAWAMSRAWGRDYFEDGAITILARQAPCVFYDSATAAEEDDYRYTSGDICPRTKGVNRLGGLRGDGREMWRTITGRRGTVPDPRFRLKLIDGQTEMIRSLLKEASLVIPALGYRATSVPIFNASGQRLALSIDQDREAVGRTATLSLAGGGIIPNIFSLGLGTGFRPWGDMGGEPNFDGQANSLWLYQNDIGKLIYRGIRSCLEKSARVGGDLHALAV